VRHCPNCRQPVEDAAHLCQNCGTDISAVWPPPPSVPQPQVDAPPEQEDARLRGLLQVAAGGLAGMAVANALASGMGIALLAFGVPMVNGRALPFVRGMGYMFLLALFSLTVSFLWNRWF